MINTCKLWDLPSAELAAIRSHGIASMFPENFSIENNFSSNLYADYYRSGSEYWINLFQRHEINDLDYDSFVDRGYTGPITNMNGRLLTEFLDAAARFQHGAARGRSMRDALLV